MLRRSRAPGCSRARPKPRCSTTFARSRGTVLRRARLIGQPPPSQRSTIRVPASALRTTSERSSVNRLLTSQRFETTVASSANGAARLSQFSSTRLPRTSGALGRTARLPSSQSTGRRNPSPSRSRLTLSRPSQSSSMPFSNTSGAPGKIRATASLQSTAVPKPSPSPSMPVSHSAMMSVKSLNALSAPAPHEIRSAIPSRASIVSSPRLAEVVVDAALPVEGVVPVAAGEHVPAAAGGDGVDSRPAGDAERRRDAVRR